MGVALHSMIQLVVSVCRRMIYKLHLFHGTCTTPMWRVDQTTYFLMGVWLTRPPTSTVKGMSGLDNKSTCNVEAKQICRSAGLELSTTILVILTGIQPNGTYPGPRMAWKKFQKMGISHMYMR